MIYKNTYKKRIILFIILAILSFFISVFSIININKNISKHKHIEENIVLSQKIKYYDEVLTMSSRMALYQDTVYWNNRYYKYVQKLDEVIKQIKQNMPVVKQELKKVDKANMKLVELEEKALEYAMNKKYELAKGFLFSKEYEESKSTYQKALDKALLLLKKEVKELEEKFQRDILLSSFVTLFFIALILIFSYYIFKYLINYNKTLEKEVKEQVKKANKKDLLLIEQSKLASMGEMLESIAHQWRQPLSSISTSVSGIRLKKSFNELDDEILEYSLSSIARATNHLSTTIDVFRQFYKDDSLKEFSLKQMLLKVQALLSSKFKHKDILFLDESIDYKVIGRENELVQVIINIISNAIDELEQLETTKLIKIQTLQNDEFISLEITDNAGGIDDSILDKVFDYKFSTKKDKNGTGIGLYMSKLIMEKAKGFISVRNMKFEYENELQVGACFKLDIKK